MTVFSRCPIIPAVCALSEVNPNDGTVLGGSAHLAYLLLEPFEIGQQRVDRLGPLADRTVTGYDVFFEAPSARKFRRLLLREEIAETPGAVNEMISQGTRALCPV